MPVTISQIASRLATVTLREGEESIKIQYHPNLLNDAAIAQLDGNMEQLTAQLTTLIASWDIYEDEAMTTLFPVERIGELGFGLRARIAWAIVRDIRPNMAAPQTPN